MDGWLGNDVSAMNYKRNKIKVMLREERQRKRGRALRSILFLKSSYEVFTAFFLSDDAATTPKATQDRGNHNQVTEGRFDGRVGRGVPEGCESTTAATPKSTAFEIHTTQCKLC
jgi:hypothetical protein